MRYEVYSPETNNVSSLVRTLRDKLHQSDRIILDLSRTNISVADLDNIIYRVNNAGGVPASNPLKEIILIYGTKVIGEIK